MNPKQFLLIGGAVLVVIGVLGFIGVIGPTAEESIFSKMGLDWWFDMKENWAHLIIGIVGLIAAFAFPAGLQRPLVMLLGIVAVAIGLYSLFGYLDLLGAHLENPADSVLHLVVGAWALLASWKKPASLMTGGMSSGMPGTM